MIDFIHRFFETQGFMPHGLCLQWKPAVLWTIVYSNLGIVLAYFVIPVALVYFILKRTEMRFKWIFVLFGLFILSCGTTHLLGIITLWNPIYGWQAIILLLTAIVSVLTAILIWPLLQKLLKVPTPFEYERKNKELDFLNQKLIRSNEELQQFSYIVSHDLKAPLRGITQLIGWVEEDNEGKLDSESSRNLSMLRERAIRMSKLIDGVLRYARVGKEEMTSEVVNTEKLLRDVWSDTAGSENFSLKLEGSFPAIQTNSIPLKQIFSNLMSNAIKYHNREKGTVTITVRELKSKYEFRVIDDGPGIDKALHDKIFQIFYTTRSEGDGESTGVGMTIVKKIIDQYGCEISVHSELGKGTEFVFTWPKEL